MNTNTTESSQKQMETLGIESGNRYILTIESDSGITKYDCTILGVFTLNGKECLVTSYRGDTGKDEIFDFGDINQIINSGEYTFTKAESDANSAIVDVLENKAAA